MYFPRGWSVGLILFVVTLGGSAGCGPKLTTPEIDSKPVSDDRKWFDDVTESSGINFTYQNGEEGGYYAILESLGGGVALIDFDGDGLLDVFVPGGGHFSKPIKEYVEMNGTEPVIKNGRYVPTSETPKLLPHPCKLFKNLGKMKFKDVTEELGFPQPNLYTHGATVADYDCDGFPDLLVTGYGGVRLYHNEADGKGGRKFRDVTAETGLELREHFWATSAAFADLDGDGFPDLYLCQYADWSFENNPACKGYTTNIARDVCPPKQFNAVPHKLFHNLKADKTGKVRFKDVSKEAGLRVGPRDDKDYGKGLGVLVVDANNDGKPDIYVANDTTENFLYVNRSTPGTIKLVEQGFDTLCARDSSGTPNGSMGVDAADFDGTGRASIWVANYEGELHALYRNAYADGNLSFRYHTQQAKIGLIGQNYVGFGTAFIDVDRDGWEDIFVLNGHVIRHPYKAGLRQFPVLLRNSGDATFAEITKQGGSFFKEEHRGRGMVVGDLDNDGHPDMILSRVNEPIRVQHHVGSDKHWIGLELTSPLHADVSGTRVIVKVAGRTLTRFVKGGGSYLSSSDRRILIGLGSAEKIDELLIEWPAGTSSLPRRQRFSDVPLNKYLKIERAQEKPMKN